MPSPEERVTKLSRKELARACVESYLDCYTLKYLSYPRKTVWQEPDMTIFSVGIPSTFWNGVLRARESPEHYMGPDALSCTVLWRLR